MKWWGLYTGFPPDALASADEFCGITKSSYIMKLILDTGCIKAMVSRFGYEQFLEALEHGSRTCRIRQLLASQTARGQPLTPKHVSGSQKNLQYSRTSLS
eukprot:6492700-Amphidinium_carterae.2